jgi:hypothetical protein
MEKEQVEKVTSRLPVGLKAELEVEAGYYAMPLNKLVIEKLRKPLTNVNELQNDAIASLQVQVGTLLIMVEELTATVAKLSQATSTQPTELEYKTLQLNKDLIRLRYSELSDPKVYTRAFNQASQTGWLSPDGLLWRTKGKKQNLTWNAPDTEEA